LVRVCVVGGGTAGEEAAFEAGRGGADATIVEKRHVPEPPWRSWPGLISGSPAVAGFVGGPRGSSPRVVKDEASAVGPGFVALSAGGRIRFDSVIIATGTRFAAATFPGIRKAGVFVLDDAERYTEVGRACTSLESVVVTGEGYRGLEVADRLSSRGVRVSLIISCWQCEPPSPVALEVIEDVARDRGTEVRRGEVSRVVGNGGVEGVVAGGFVVPCEAVVVAPPRVPNPVRASVRLGSAGAIEVDRGMRTSDPSLLAAGGCAEVKGGPPGSGVLNAEPSLSGRIAGSNCTGSWHSIGGTKTDELHVFGLRWSRTGRREWTSGALGSQAETVSRRWCSDCACAISHQRFSETVTRVESIQPSASSPAGFPPLGAGVTLEALAFGLGSSDISPISETARLGLREWPKS
jgi:NADPH-dependent 2,4-dienoyl-CoA reductase/sulfur reductase-like enzyme